MIKARVHVHVHEELRLVLRCSVVDKGISGIADSDSRRRRRRVQDEYTYLGPEDREDDRSAGYAQDLYKTTFSHTKTSLPVNSSVGDGLHRASVPRPSTIMNDFGTVGYFTDCRTRRSKAPKALSNAANSVSARPFSPHQA